MWSLALEKECIAGACCWAQVVARHCWKICSKGCCRKCLSGQGCATVAVCPTAPAKYQRSRSLPTLHVPDHRRWLVKPRGAVFLSWGLDQARGGAEGAWCCCAAWGVSGRHSGEGFKFPCPESFGVLASCRERQERLGPAFEVCSTANRMHLFR